LSRPGHSSFPRPRWERRRGMTSLSRWTRHTAVRSSSGAKPHEGASTSSCTDGTPALPTTKGIGPGRHPQALASQASGSKRRLVESSQRRPGSSCRSDLPNSAARSGPCSRPRLQRPPTLPSTPSMTSFDGYPPKRQPRFVFRQMSAAASPPWMPGSRKQFLSDGQSPTRSSARSKPTRIHPSRWKKNARPRRTSNDPLTMRITS
jgi:hypothetical protein